MPYNTSIKVFFARFILGILLLSFGSLYAQTTDDGRIISTVKDSTGLAISDASVTIQSDSTGISVAAIPGADGSYVSPLLRPGKYTVKVEAQGFKGAILHIALDINQKAAMNFELQIGSATETVNVQASTPLVDPESSTVGVVQNEEAVANLPLNTRNFNQLISLTAGTVPGNTQLTGALPITATRGTVANQVNGIGFRSNNYRVDGLDNSENHNGQGILLYPPVEAIQEFRVQTSVPQPEFGHGGAAISVAYKSGGSHFHGDVFYFLRNAEYFDAKNYFDPAGPIAPLHYNNYGVTLGGPVVLPHFNHNRDKLFFFFSWEGVRKTQSLTYVSTVPLTAYQSGDFSGYGKQLYDPLTTVTVGGVVSRSPFAGNQINPNRFNQTGLNLVKLFPAPNLAGVANNYVSTPVSTDRRDDFDLKLDGNISPNNQVFARISRQNSNIYFPGSLPAPAVGNALGNTVQYPLYQVASGYTRVFSAHVINELRAGFTRLDNRAFNANYGNDVANQVGIPGVNLPGKILTTGLTEIDLTGYATLGDSGSYPAIIANNNFQINDAVTWLYKKHTFKFGGEVLRRQENVYQNATQHGDMGFGPTYTTDPAIGGSNGNSIADLLLGAPTAGNIAYVPGTFGKRRTDIGIYAQDAWRITNKLTLNLGVRWDIFPQYPWAIVKNRAAYFVPSLGAVYNVNTPQIPWRSGAQPRYNDFGPRVGFAYSATPTTIVRGAYGLFYSPDMGTDTGNENAPYVGSVTFANTTTNFTGAHKVSDGFTPPAGTGNYPTIGAALFALDPHLKTPSASQYNFGVEQSVPSQILLTFNYVGTYGTSLIQEPNINQPTPGPGAVAARRPFPLYSTISEIEGSSHSNYNSLQVSAEKRLTKNLQFLASYTWSHALDLGAYVGTPQNINDFASEYGNSDYNLPNRFTLSGELIIPFGHGQTFGANVPMLVDTLLGGWRLSTITNLFSGLPFTPTSGVNTLNGSGAQRPNRIASGVLPSGQRTIQHWFDTSAFTIPAPYQFGNSRRDILSGPATHMADISLSKSFALSKDQVRSLELRVDAFNISNTPEFNNPNASIGTANAGTISSAGSPITFQRTSRQLQLSGKIHF